MRRFLIREVLYPLYRRLKRDHVLDYLRQMRTIQTRPADEIREFQLIKLKRLLKYAAAHVPHYRRLFNELHLDPEDFRSLDDLSVLPPLRKSDVNRAPDEFVSEIYPRKQLALEKTSGSTGESFYFYIDQPSSEARRASAVRMNEWIGIRIGDPEVRLWGTAFEVSRTQRLRDAVHNWLSNIMMLSVYRNVDSGLAEYYLKKLSRFNPYLVIGYPSALTHICELIVDRDHGLRPKAVIATGETVYDWQKEIIEKALRAPVYNHYGCREFGAIARECRLRNGLHIGSERVLVEIDNTGEYGDGVGELLITDLDNIGMPMIRYAVGDVGKLTWEPCECGLTLPRFESLLGRTLDMIRTPRGGMVPGQFFLGALKKRKGAAKLQVIQEKIDEIKVILVPSPELSADFYDQAVSEIKRVCGEEMKVKFEIRQELETTPAGKYRFVISKIGKNT